MAPSRDSLDKPFAFEETAPALPSLARMPLIDVLRLIRTNNVGPITFFQLIRRFGNAAEALDRLPEITRRVGKAPASPFTREQAEAEIAATEKFGAKLIRYGEPDYPPMLLHIPDPPPVIAARGNAALWSAKPCFGMVGARNASAGGCSLAQKLARELADAGIVIASGLARGIDTFAHKGALAGGTVAVIAGGIDNIYPPENEKLYAQITERGAIISEQPFGTAPFSGSFPGRNRIIAGMSLGILVVEAAAKSGSLITARYAAEQGREVFAIPGSPLDPRAQGPNALIKQGAHLAESAADILEALPSFKPPERLEEADAEAFFAAPGPEPSEAELAAAHAVVLEKLSPTPVFIDELLSQCQLPVGLFFTVLMELELAGRAQRVAGNKICVAAGPYV